MKTPLDNFEFTHEVYNIQVSIEAKHKALPIIFTRRYYRTINDSLNPNQLIMDITTKVCKDIIMSSIYGVAQTFQNSNYEQMGILSKHIHQPEWDKEKEAWFILDENNNKVYE